MIFSTRSYILIAVWITLIFMYTHRDARNLKFCTCYLSKISNSLDEIREAVGTYQRNIGNFVRSIVKEDKLPLVISKHKIRKSWHACVRTFLHWSYRAWYDNGHHWILRFVTSLNDLGLRLRYQTYEKTETYTTYSRKVLSQCGCDIMSWWNIFDLMDFVPKSFRTAEMTLSFKVIVRKKWFQRRCPADVCGPIYSKLNMMIDTTQLYSLTSGRLTLTFRRCQQIKGKPECLLSFSCKARCFVLDWTWSRYVFVCLFF